MKNSLVHEAASDSAMMHAEQQKGMQWIELKLKEHEARINELKSRIITLEGLASNYYEKGMTIP